MSDDRFKVLVRRLARENRRLNKEIADLEAVLEAQSLFLDQLWRELESSHSQRAA